MADGGEEFALGSVSHFGRLLGDHQRLLGGGMFDCFPAAGGALPSQRSLGLSECPWERFSGGCGFDPGWGVRSRHGLVRAGATPLNRRLSGERG